MPLWRHCRNQHQHPNIHDPLSLSKPCCSPMTGHGAKDTASSRQSHRATSAFTLLAERTRNKSTPHAIIQVSSLFSDRMQGDKNNLLLLPYYSHQAPLARMYLVCSKQDGGSNKRDAMLQGERIGLLLHPFACSASFSARIFPHLVYFASANRLQH